MSRGGACSWLLLALMCALLAPQSQGLAQVPLVCQQGNSAPVCPPDGTCIGRCCTSDAQCQDASCPGNLLDFFDGRGGNCNGLCSGTNFPFNPITHRCGTTLADPIYTTSGPPKSPPPPSPKSPPPPSPKSPPPPSPKSPPPPSPKSPPPPSPKSSPPPSPKSPPPPSPKSPPPPSPKSPPPPSPKSPPPPSPKTPPPPSPKTDKCANDKKCSNCLAQNNAVYWLTGVAKVCSSCLDVPKDMREHCFKCLSWAVPTNPDGSFCTKCANLSEEEKLGGDESAHKCFDCTVNLGATCTQPTSCASPPKHTATGKSYQSDPDEMKKCWNCMAQHRLYAWGTGKCGNPQSYPLEANPLPLVEKYRG
ncbi:hypothetical protein FOA52_012609 [Chlamydomonas sp. UWO 241]|nr:hypothetical protein FOA52_012609 [Chlamydomonas sp. UWO 241]